MATEANRANQAEMATSDCTRWAPYYPAMATEANRPNQAEMATSDCTRWAPFVISVILPEISGVHNRQRPRGGDLLLCFEVNIETALREFARAAISG
jgi:hypothetical protein